MPFYLPTFFLILSARRHDKLGIKTTFPTLKVMLSRVSLAHFNFTVFLRAQPTCTKVFYTAADEE